VGVERTRPSATAVIVLDVQEGPAKTISREQLAELERAATILLGAAAELGAPVIVTAQHAKVHGPLWPTIQQLVARTEHRVIDKLTFSACNEPAFVQELKSTGAETAIVLGLEAHVGVFQTARDLVARGLRVDVPVDGVVARRADHREVGLRLCEKAGATLTTAETILFDWVVQAETEIFRKLSPLVT
jgi:nicotinamidase-related amidase